LELVVTRLAFDFFCFCSARKLCASLLWTPIRLDQDEISLAALSRGFLTVIFLRESLWNTLRIAFHLM
jgi:hypothetical protein